MTCTFFGHSLFTQPIYETLKLEISRLIDQGVSLFYVGNNGLFDQTVQIALKNLFYERSDFEYSIVLSRLDEAPLTEVQNKTLFPIGLERALPRFAISKRNEWLLNHSNFAICFVAHNYSNSFKWLERAKRKGLKIINIANY